MYAASFCFALSVLYIVQKLSFLCFIVSAALIFSAWFRQYILSHVFFLDGSGVAHSGSVSSHTLSPSLPRDV
jgi:hypothetical protein